MPKNENKACSSKAFLKQLEQVKLMKMKANKSHILNKKSTKRKRTLRKAVEVDATNAKNDEAHLHIQNNRRRNVIMARIKGGLNAKKKHNRVLKLAKGYRGARSKQYRVAKQSVMRALTSSFAGRKQRKRQFRRLWIARINAAARMNGFILQPFYVWFENLAEIDINRKMLSEMAISDPEGFC